MQLEILQIPSCFKGVLGVRKKNATFEYFLNDTFLNYFIMITVLFPRRIILMQQIEDDTPEGLKGTSFVWGLKSVIAWQELLAFCLVLAKIHETVPESPPSASLIIFFTSSLVQIQQMILRYGSKKCCKVVQFPESSDPFCGHRWAIMFKNVESKHVDVDRTL